MKALISLLVTGVFFAAGIVPAYAQGGTASLRLLDRAGQETVSLTDGNTVQLSIKLPAPLQAAAEAAFYLEGLAEPVATCTIAAGAEACTSAAFTTTGWYWGADGSAHPGREIQARVGGQVQGALKVQIRSRPVVMVHGFISNWETWKPYLGADGYLAALGLQGFAVGDGQAPGVLNTGNPANPEARTNSIAQNAEILGQYIAAVQQKTGAEKVDLLVHSMGGMISRYYIDRVMNTDNVAQVIFLGTPMSGSACVFPVAALGFLMPASLEIQPDYMVNIFNQQVKHRHGIPFYMVAGTLLVEQITSPCAAAPSDTVVALGSATSIPLDDIQKFPLYHGDLTGDRSLFERGVRPLLEALPPAFAPRPDPPVPSTDYVAEQFSRTYTGHIDPGGEATVTVNIDPNVSLASFSLYDSSRSLAIEVRGASGKVIELNVEKNGLIKIDDPATMLYLGYGFQQPKPGAWVVKLRATDKTPAAGASYALNARFGGGAQLVASTSPTIPQIGQAVAIKAQLQADSDSPTVTVASAQIRTPDGRITSLAMTAEGEAYSAVYTPTQAGLYSIEVMVSGQTADGSAIDRAAYLTFEAQPGANQVQQVRFYAIFAAIALILVLVGLALLGRLRRERQK